MRLDEKRKITEELARSLREAGTIYLTDFTGLDVQAMTEFRGRLLDRGLRYVVVKNTLMRRAMEGLDLPDLSDHLQGPTGLVLGDDDPVVPAKVVREFAQEHEDRPVVKVAIVDRRTIGPEEVGALAVLPPRDQLLASIAGSLTAPVAGIVGVLEGLLRDIACMVEEVAKKRGGESDDASEPEAAEEPAARPEVDEEPAAQAEVGEEPAAQAEAGEEPAAQAEAGEEPATETEPEEQGA